MPDGAVIVRVEVPGTGTLLALSPVERAGAPLNASPTVPEKPKMLVMLMVEVQDEPPATTARKNGSGNIAKSGRLTSTFTVIDELRLPLVPVTWTEYDPVSVDAGALTVRTELPTGGPTLTVVGFNVAVRGLSGE